MFVSVRFYVYVVYVGFHGFESPVVAYVLCVVNPCVCAYLCMCVCLSLWVKRSFHTDFYLSMSDCM